MKKFLGIFLAAILCVMLAVAASAADVYVNDGGTGDGSSADAPLGSMTDAINKIGADGGKVIIVDTYTCAEEYYEPEHVGNIVITGGKYVFSQGQYNRWFLSGPGSTTFENMSFEYGAGTTSLIIAQYNKLVLGEGLSFDASGKAYVIGGYQVPLTDTAVFDRDSDVTVKSGNYWLVAGHSRGSTEYSFVGTAHITVEGGEIATVYGASVNGNYSGNAVINIKGGTINNLRTAGDETRRLDGDCTVNISGGMVTLLSLNNVMGKTTVNFSGGSVANAEKTVEPAIEMFVTDGTATLNATPNVDAKIISLFFDKVNYVSAIPDETPAQTAAPAATTAAPAATTAAPAATTAAPAATTATPAVTTAAPVVTTAAPAKTTATPAVTTAAPIETAEAPAVTTAAPATTTAAPTTSAEDGGSNIGLIIGIALVVVVVAVIVVVYVKKKK